MRRPALAPSLILPGILLAATGVGAGDLLTAGLAGSAVGTGILWAAVLGGMLKWVLSEGIARWQMATGTTFLQGWVTHLGSWGRWVFLLYLVIWTPVVCGALFNACGIAGAAFIPIGTDATSKVVWGIIHALAGLLIVRAGKFGTFERVMSVFVGLMLAAVIVTALLVHPQGTGLAGGLMPTFPTGGTLWIMGVLGGVGGTVTLLSYGYWIREAGRTGVTGLRECRLDLLVCYTVTVIFGCSMIIIGSTMEIDRGEGTLANVAVRMSNLLQSATGEVGRVVFLIGFWAAVFSSLLGVLQGVPYIFADFCRLTGRAGETDDPADAPDGNMALTATPAYRNYQVAMVVVPLPLLILTVRQAQLAYAVLGALFMPLLALSLLLLNSRHGASEFRNGRLTGVVLFGTLCFFAYVAIRSMLSHM